ncbi:MAG TPA: hypothetical protein VLS93_08145 [Anaeromyxobacteraceae bacterium]|nr:hypothetical protein [Anaeromyxobacteraceae bacterium]
MKLRPFAAAALAALAAGCADNNASLRWGPICFPSDDCTFSSTCDAQYIGFIELDSAAPSVWLLVEVHNQRPSTENLDYGRLDTAYAYIQELVITNDLTPVEYVVPAVFVIPSSGTGVISVLIPNAVAGSAVVAYQVRMRGVWGDGTGFESAALEIPVYTCGGCGWTCPAGTGCPVDSGQAPIACGS